MAYYDPFDDPQFKKHLDWFILLDPGILRHHAHRDGLITTFQKRELEAERQPASHNNKFLDYIRPGGKTSYRLLLLVIRKAWPTAFATCDELEKVCQSHTTPEAAAIPALLAELELPSTSACIRKSSPNYGGNVICFSSPPIRIVPQERFYELHMGCPASSCPNVSTLMVVKSGWKPHGCTGLVEISQKGNLRCTHPARCCSCRLVDARFDCGLRGKGSPHSDGLNPFRKADLQSMTDAMAVAMAMGTLHPIRDVVFSIGIMNALVAQFTE